MTRANVIIKYDNKELFLYRHCDGYPEGLGTDLSECISSLDPLEILFNILKNCDLEITDSIHGDIEYLYTIVLNKNFITLSFRKYD